MSHSLDRKMDETLVVPGLLGARKVYVLKKYDTEQHCFVADESGGETSELASAHRFGSRLAARGFTLNKDKQQLYGFTAADWQIIQIELVPPPERIEVIDGLAIEDPVKCIERIVELHQMYADRVAAWVRHATHLITDYSAPRVCITVRPQMRWRGLYSPRDNTCHYVLPAAMLSLGSAPKTHRDYEETIAHEVVHAYQRHFVGQFVGSGHGGDFFAMMRHAALYPTVHSTHESTQEEMKRCIVLFKKLQKPMERIAQEGRLSHLPCTIVTEQIKRSGLA